MQSLRKQEVFLFLGLYALGSIIYYTATWISWGGFEPGHPSYFNLQEFLAAAGTQFTISCLLTIPIWWVTVIVLQPYSLRWRLAAHLFFLPLYLILCYFSQLEVTKLFGWAMFWGGTKTVWTFYNLLLFYLVQFGFIYAYTYFKRFKQEEREKAALREIALQSELLALKAQLNPHFLHNLFNSISATLPPESEQARELIVQLSDLFRYQNYAAQQEYVTVGEEIAFIENYLQLMKIRLKHRLHYQLEVPAEYHHFKIAPMLLHPLVENAINHGMAPKIAPSHLVISLRSAADRLIFSIADTGVGIPDKELAFNSGLGLSNTRMRLQKIYKSDLTVEDNTPTGTKISFAIKR